MTDPRWLPLPLVEDVGWFADDACTVSASFGRATAFDATCASLPQYGFRLAAADACGAQAPSFFRLGPELMGVAMMYLIDPNSYACFPNPDLAMPSSAPLVAFPFGDPVPTSAFAATAQVRTGEGQLQLVEAAGPDGPPVHPQGFFDRVHGQPCSVRADTVAADGAARCLPDADRGLENRRFFVDAGCTAPLEDVPVAPSGCAAAPPRFVSSEELVPESESGPVDTPTRRVHLHRVAELFSGTVHERQSDLTCVEASPSSIDGLAFYAVGPELPASAFAAVRTVRPR